ncbi:MurR/RpiR family transcriptional regulator [Actinomyces sp. ZJ308]|uniref:MurR/RpiR family transcriptional regulator n=1 Tax=Actinomyces sp. ZJ308 TaxID=2708342 RepID=UPI001421F0FC|nr:MurR/RpiR family transcriptional regulator [Actinomyces sp. ZJ308]
MEPSEDTPFLNRLASARLTSRELDVARFYEDNLPGAALLNLEEVCRAVGVSSATAGRFARKLGYPDFRAMSRSLRAGVREDLSLPVERLRRLRDDRAETASSPRSILDRRVTAAQEVLSGCPTAIDEEAFTRTCALVGDADRPLYLGAVATGRPLMQYFGLLLSYLRGDVVILEGTDRWAHALAGLGDDAVVLAATFDRHPSPIEALLRLARQRGATSILLTNRRTGPLVPMADILLTTPSISQEAMFRTRAATLVVLEAVLDAVAAEHPEHRRAEAVEETFDLMRGYL